MPRISKGLRHNVIRSYKVQNQRPTDSSKWYTESSLFTIMILCFAPSTSICASNASLFNGAQNMEPEALEASTKDMWQALDSNQDGVVCVSHCKQLY